MYSVRSYINYEISFVFFFMDFQLFTLVVTSLTGESL